MPPLLLTIGPQLTIASVPVPSIIGQPGAAEFRATGAVGPVRWTLVDSTLPAEWDDALTIVDGVASLSATELATPGAFTVTVRAVDTTRQPVQQTFAVRVIALPLSVSGTVGPWTVGSPVSEALTISGGAPPYSSIAATLPTSVSRSVDGDEVDITGTPSAGHGVSAGASGTFSASITIQDSLGAIATWTQSVTYSVPALVCTITSLPDAEAGSAWTGQVEASGGAGAKALSLDTAPAWMNIDPGTGELTGAPEVGDIADGVTVTARATDAEANTDTDTDTLDVKPVPVVYATWNPSDKGAEIVLSNGNLTATHNGALNRLVRATTQIVGKVYYEITITDLISLSTLPILTTAARSVNENLMPFNLVDVWVAVLYNTSPIVSAVYVEPSTASVLYPSGGGGHFTFTIPTTIGIAVDMTAGELYVRLNGQWARDSNTGAASDPVTATRPLVSGSVITNRPWPAFAVRADSSGLKSVTANFGQSAFVGAVPSGYTAGLIVP